MKIDLLKIGGIAVVVLDLAALVMGGGKRLWPLPPPEGGVQNPLFFGELMLLPMLLLIVLISGALICPPFERWLARNSQRD